MEAPTEREKSPDLWLMSCCSGLCYCSPQEIRGRSGPRCRTNGAAASALDEALSPVWLRNREVACAELGASALLSCRGLRPPLSSFPSAKKKGILPWRSGGAAAAAVLPLIGEGNAAGLEWFEAAAAAPAAAAVEPTLVQSLAPRPLSVWVLGEPSARTRRV